jgi:hypothetical protein
MEDLLMMFTTPGGMTSRQISAKRQVDKEASRGGLSTTA